MLSAITYLRTPIRQLARASSRLVELPEVTRLRELSRNPNSLLSKPNLVFHGVSCFNIEIILRILTHGILSLRESHKLDMEIDSPEDNYNDVYNVCVARSPVDICSNLFFQWIQQNVSFAIDASKLELHLNQYIESNNPYYAFERNVLHKIPPETIKGVMVPRHALTTPLSELSYMTIEKFQVRPKKTIYENIARFLQEHFDYQMEMNELEQLDIEGIRMSNPDYCDGLVNINTDNIKTIYKRINWIIANHIEKAYRKKFGIRIPVFSDVLERQLQGKIPLFDSEGFPL
jgi:hypothetical protein